ncbi:MAG: hypothetical protein K8W52_02100 [Deltaproteobacteria bacterium]|nr:hypothetical protein [Deltaproteobacteria bacterium]
MRFLRFLPLLLPLAACAGLDDATDGDATDDALTSAGGVEHTLDFDAFVDVAPGASDADARDAIHRQLKSALGALRERGIGVADRDAQRNLAIADLPRERKDVIDSGAVVGQVDRVRYHYRDTALVDRDRLPTAPIDLTLLYGDYVARAAELTPICSDDSAAEPDSLWYHFAPGRSTCKSAIRAEQRAIDAARATLAPTQLAVRDRDRRFLATRATLVAAAAAPDTWPEYDRLWGFTGDTAREKVVVYSFFGVDSNEADPHDNGLVEYLRHQRTLRARMPGLRVVETAPQAWLLDFWIDGARLDGVTWDDVERWVIDGTGFPAVVGTDAGKRAALLDQVVANFSERWIVWQRPVTVTRNGVTRAMTVEIRTFHGYEDGSPEVRQRARWRYLEAFWHGDVFAYTGHSHFGHGPLEPWTYARDNFPDRYQTMLINSCLSFNYYDEDFLAMHPGGSRELDVTVNGLAAYWNGMGAATGAYLAGLLDGENQRWRDVLTGMRVDLPWQRGYDPMRAVNGELDNAFTPAAGAITLAPY